MSSPHQAASEPWTPVAPDASSEAAGARPAPVEQPPQIAQIVQGEQPPLARFPMRQAIGLELAKMRRLRVVPILLAVTATTTVLAASALFSASARASWADPDSDLWAALLLSCTMMAGALTGPLSAAIMAGHLTDIEHSGSGWNLAAGVGLTPGRLLRAKVAALALLIVPAIVIQSLALIAVGTAVGIAAPVPVGAWVSWTVSFAVLQMIMVAGHAWLSAVVPNQLVSMAAGLLGSFVAVYLLLAPAWLARLLPWGYYAVISPIAMHDNQIVLVTPGWPFFGMLVLAAVSLFTVVTARLDRIEERGIALGISRANGGPERRRRGAGRAGQGHDSVLRASGARAQARPGRRPSGRGPALVGVEVSKLRRSAVPVVAVVIPLLTVIAGAVNYWGNQGVLSWGWESLASQVTVFYSLIFAPMAVALLVSATWRVEHRGTSWNMMRTTPHSTVAIVLAKAAAVLAPVIVMELVLLAMTWIAGMVLGLGWRMPLELLAQGAVFVLACLPLIGVQSLLSMRMRSFAGPVAVCLGQVVVAFMLVATANPASTVWPAALVTRALSLGSIAISTAGGLDVAGIAPILAGALVSGLVCWAALALAARRRE
ncbi:MAG: ABC transporter permease [Actinomyces sp.]|uniref:ABC transporter permease n=1 Tax=Actinomyces sp. TaxID=29317 RepID=UPI0026DA8A96|nr:ABC transporter permease [Actinomyces sp.]MDO4242869.1 ABC transporter permease [Actinomyces sp.]